MDLESHQPPLWGKLPPETPPGTPPDWFRGLPKIRCNVRRALISAISRVSFGPCKAGPLGPLEFFLDNSRVPDDGMNHPVA